MIIKSLWKIVFATALFCVFSEASAFVTIQVNSTADEIDDDVTDGVCHTASGKCTLRAATMTANRETFDTQINVPAGIYTLSIPAAPGIDEGSGDLDLTAPTASTNVSISIVGAGVDATVIDGAGQTRVFNIGSSRNATLRGLTIRGGRASGSEGGGILNGGTLSLYFAKVTGSSSAYGGGIYNSGFLILEAATIANNIASIDAGGIYNIATLAVEESMIIGNVSQYGAGGVENGFSGVLSCFYSTFDSNSGSFGGAVQTAGTVQILNCTFSNNSSEDGGALAGDGQLTMINSTVANNHATDSGGGFFKSQDDNNPWNVYNSTIAYNDADSDADRNGSGGGIFVEEGGGVTGKLNIYNTLVAGNTVGQSPQPDDCDGAGNGVLYTHANNLFGTTAKCPIVQVSGAYGTLNSLSYLGPLADNGGDTKTVALLRGSSAIDAGYSAGCFDDFSNLIRQDQRGFPRPVGAACDVGAYEYNDDIFKNGFE